MPLKSPNLDDRTYADLRQLALQHIQKQLNVDWTDLSPGDPGVMLLEVFAYLTDQLIYRLNRVPQEKVYVALLRMLGASLYPPAAALVELEFRNLNEQEVVIPAATQVTSAEGDREAAVFITTAEIVVPAAQRRDSSAEPEDEQSTAATARVRPGSARVKARHCRYVQRELHRSTGEAGQLLTVLHPPIVAATHDNFDLLVEVQEGENFVTWSETPNFSLLQADSRVYVVDRMEGAIRFAPAASMTVDGQLARRLRPLAATPPTGAIVRISYAYGGGLAGNVAANTLTTLLPAPIPGVSVTNPSAAVGGQAAETLANALLRGPQEIYTLERAITARDFERLAEQPGVGISRAKASTQLERWAHGQRGTVEIRLVPQLTGSDMDIVHYTRERQQAGEQALEIQNLRRVLADSQPMGAAVVLKWAHYKKVWVEATITLKERAALSTVRARLLPALTQLVAPLARQSHAGRKGWPFGQTLYASDVHRLLVEDEGVDAVTRLNLCVEAAPNRQVNAVAADRHQPQTWFAASGRRLFRSFNNGEGWEEAPDFPAADAAAREETIRLIRPSPDRAGLVAVWVHQISADGGHRFIPFVSTDCGEQWHRLASFNGRVEDVAWIARGDTPIMLLATDQGLFKLELNLHPSAPGGSYTAIGEMQQPLHAVVVIKKNTQVYVAVALQSRGGVYLANGLFLAYDVDQDWFQTDVDGAAAQPAAARQLFRPLESGPGAAHKTLAGEDIRLLAVQYEDHDDPAQRVWLWAGAMSIGWEGNRRSDDDAGRGCFVWEVNTPQPLRGKWARPEGWMGGSCRGIDFLAGMVVAVSQWGGALHLEQATQRWQQTNSVALPRRGADVERNFAPLAAVAANYDRTQPVFIAGGANGLYVTKDGGVSFVDGARTRFDYRVTLPDDWLFVAGEHRIVTSESDLDDSNMQGSGLNQSETGQANG